MRSSIPIILLAVVTQARDTKVLIEYLAKAQNYIGYVPTYGSLFLPICECLVVVLVAFSGNWMVI